MSHTLLAVFAHPDDETFAIGGTLARLHDRHVRTALYVATDGAAGRASGVTVRDRAELARLRRAELLRAAGVLGVGRVFMPGWPDGELGMQDEAAVVGGIVRAIRLVQPNVVVTFGPEGGPNRHRDHQAISRFATSAVSEAGGATRLYYFTWSERQRALFGVEGLPVTCRMQVGRWMHTKREAFEQHRTQWDHRARFEETVDELEEFSRVSLSRTRTRPAP